MIQLQDTDAGSEIIHMAECRFCTDGEQEKLLVDGSHRDPRFVAINTDGGLIANGEPISASGSVKSASSFGNCAEKRATGRSPASRRSASPSSAVRPGPQRRRSSPDDNHSVHPGADLRCRSAHVRDPGLADRVSAGAVLEGGAVRASSAGRPGS